MRMPYSFQTLTDAHKHHQYTRLLTLTSFSQVSITLPPSLRVSLYGISSQKGVCSCRYIIPGSWRRSLLLTSSASRSTSRNRCSISSPRLLAFLHVRIKWKRNLMKNHDPIRKLTTPSLSSVRFGTRDSCYP